VKVPFLMSWYAPMAIMIAIQISIAGSGHWYVSDVSFLEWLDIAGPIGSVSVINKVFWFLTAGPL
jgi:hypothetical protein